MTPSAYPRTPAAEALDWPVEVDQDATTPLRALGIDDLHRASQLMLRRGNLDRAASLATLQMMLVGDQLVSDLSPRQIELALFGADTPAPLTTTDLTLVEAAGVVAAGEAALALLPHTS